MTKIEALQELLANATDSVNYTQINKLTSQIQAEQWENLRDKLKVVPPIKYYVMFGRR